MTSEEQNMDRECPSEKDTSRATETGNLWGAAVNFAVCDQCHWVYVVDHGANLRMCPNCFRGALTLMEQGYWEENARPPELFLPHVQTREAVSQKIRYFASGLWFPPSDLTPDNLIWRAQRVFLPLWLVDCAVEAAWDAEMGFDYQVVSHQDHYDENRSGWESQQVQETRVRWEPRLGRLKRTYTNISAPALDEHTKVMQLTGTYDLANLKPYAPDVLDGAFLRLPDRPIEDVWPEAIDGLKQAAADECRRAAGADHVRQYQWSPVFADQQWTLLLLPVYQTYYLDDDGKPQKVMLNGQTGQLSGRRRASVKRAQRAAMWILGAAAILFLFSLVLLAVGIFIQPVLVLGGLVFSLSILVALAAIAPPAIAWNINRKLAQGG